jgi:hypothetical protein
MRPLLLTIFYFVATACCLQGQPLSSMQTVLDTGYFARKSVESIKIDGLLTEDTWEKAHAIDWKILDKVGCLLTLYWPVLKSTSPSAVLFFLNPDTVQQPDQQHQHESNVLVQSISIQ